MAGTTGTLSVARGGTGATALTDLITLTTHTTGNYVKKVTVGTGLGGAVDSEGGTAAMTLDAAQTTINSILATDLILGEDSTTSIDFGTPDAITISAGGEKMILAVEGSGGDQADKVTINEDAADIDFQVKGDNDANLFRTDALNDRVGIGTLTPSKLSLIHI